MVVRLLFLVIALAWADPIAEELFKDADENGDGYIEQNEAAGCVQGAITSQTLSSMMAQCDVDHDSRLSLQEFKQAVEKHSLISKAVTASTISGLSSQAEGHDGNSRFASLKAAAQSRAAVRKAFVGEMASLATTKGGTPCDASDCSYHGTAGGNKGGCSCVCNYGWQDGRCGTAVPCTRAGDCNSRGTASGNRPTGCSCRCDFGFGAASCNQYVSCDRNDCSGNGQGYGYKLSGCACGCDNGFSGANCASQVPCARDYCNNRGSTGGYVRTGCAACSCDDKSSWMGTQCQTKVPCDAVVDCNGGTATGTRVDGCTCSNCPRQYTGKKCEIPPDPCSGVNCDTPPDTCHSKGTCQDGKCSYPALTGNACDDGDSNTVGDKCAQGVCQGKSACLGYDCSQQKPALMIAQCLNLLKATCTVANGKPICAFPNAADGLACNDGNDKTRADACHDGVCTGADPCLSVICKAIDTCHDAGECKDGLCSHPKKTSGSWCDDGDPATSGDQCDENAACKGTLLPVDGGLTDWGQCSVTCGGGTQTRTCENPKPGNGGKPCCDGNLGKSACPSIRACQTQQCASALAQAQAALEALKNAGPKDACNPTPCKNNGKCTLSPASTVGFHCDCNAGWGGSDCSVRSSSVSHADSDYQYEEARAAWEERRNDEVLGTPRWTGTGLQEWLRFDPNLSYDYDND